LKKFKKREKNQKKKKSVDYCCLLGVVAFHVAYKLFAAGIDFIFCVSKNK